MTAENLTARNEMKISLATKILHKDLIPRAIKIAVFE